ncbi:MAG: hypothetical protein K8S94_02355 [Planctomycetia bacterium]|jgi:hypothetical protein|nr:hypothetical protein [Planctomycetia bacterium]
MPSIQINNVFVPHSAAELQAIDHLDPGRAAKILQLQEDWARSQLEREKAQTQHRIALEASQVSHDQRISFRGQWFAWSLGIGGLAGSVALGWIGQTWACVGLSLVVTGAIASAFILGKKATAKERISKLEMLLEAEKQLRKLGVG